MEDSNSNTDDEENSEKPINGKSRKRQQQQGT
jgi:hypothetical protein